MVVQGNEASLNFQYITISLMGCDETILPEGDVCENYENVNNKFLKFDGLQNFIDFNEPEPNNVVKPNKISQSTIVMDVSQI